MNVIRICTLLITILLLSISSQAKDLDFESVDVEITILPNGDLAVVEYRTYRFEGSFSWADYRLNRSEFGEIYDLRVDEMGNSYQQSDSEEPGTYHLIEKKNERGIKWYYSAKDTTRRFIISYTLTDVLEVGPGWALLDWHLLSDEWKESTEYFSATIQFESVDPNLLINQADYWVRSQAEVNGNMTPKSLNLKAQSVSKRHDIRLRFVFPSSLINQAQITNPDLSKASVVEAEEQYQEYLAEEARKAEERRIFANFFIPILPVISILLFVAYYRRYKPKNEGEAITLKPNEKDGFPTHHKPAMISWLFLGSASGGILIMSTLLDLARRGLIKLTYQGKDKKKQKVAIEITPKDNVPLDEYESELLSFLQSKIDKGLHTLDEMFKDSSRKTHKWKREWEKTIKDHFNRLQWYNMESRSAAVKHGFIQAVLVICSIFLTAWSFPYGLLALILCGAGLFLSFAIYQRNARGEKVYNAWKEVRTTMMKRPGDAARSYSPQGVLIYAGTLGVSKKKMKAVLEHYDIAASDEFKQMIHNLNATTEQLDAVDILATAAYGTLILPATMGSAGVAGGAGAAASGGAAGGAG